MREISSSLLWIPLAAYLLGSIPFGLLIAKVFGGGDVRKAGSGNVGATNVTRVAGPFAGIVTLVLDAAKGSGAVWLAAYFSGEAAGWMILAGLAALIGHCFPVWLRFRGGKGVATAAGKFFILSPLALWRSVLLFFIFFACFRFVFFGATAAAAP